MNDPITWWAVFSQGVLTGIGVGLAASFTLSAIAFVILTSQWREDECSAD